MKGGEFVVKILKMVPVAFLAVSIAFAEEAPPLKKIGVVNVDKLFKEYARTKSQDAKLAEFSRSKEAQREKLVSEVKTMREELLLLDAEARGERQKAIDEKLRALAEFDRDVKETLRKQSDEAFKAIVDEIEATVAAFAKERGFDLIISQRAVLYGMPALDTTDQVLAVLNDRYAKKRP